MPCVDPERALPNAFEGDAMKSVHRFALSVRAGSGFSHADLLQMAAVLHKAERVASGARGGEGGDVTEVLRSPESFAAGLRAKQDRVLAERGWKQVPITTGGTTYILYHRYLLDVGIVAV